MLTPSDRVDDRPLFDSRASRAIETQALAGGPPMALMNRAGRSLARLVLAVARPRSAVLVVTGPGNNGGDGWVAARHLLVAGWPVRVWEVLPAQAKDAKAARAAAVAAGVVVMEGPPWAADAMPAQTLQAHGLVILDALLGLGVRSPLPAPIARAIDWMAQTQHLAGPGVVRLLSVDMPSGLDPDRGTPARDEQGRACAVRADHTLSLLTLKPGLFTHEGRDRAGRIWFDGLDVGVGSVPPCARLVPDHLMNTLTRGRLNSEGRACQGGHKGQHGDTWLVGGAPGMGGALLLAARAALAAGAGRVHRVHLATDQNPARSAPEDQAPRGNDGIGAVLDVACPEVMTPTWSALKTALKPVSSMPLHLNGGASSPVPDESARPAQPHRVIVAGCGGGLLMNTVLPELLHRAPCLVLDADALNAVAADTQLQRALRDRRSRGQLTVLTPHPLEAARLLDCSTAQVQANRLAAAQALAERTGSTVVLKGSGSVVASPDLLPWINASGNTRLATGGTGDVLAGWIGGAWSSTGPSAPVRPPSAGRVVATDAAAAAGAALHELVAACVHLHGRAAEADAGAGGRPATTVLRASALIDEMARELVRAAHGDER